MQRSWFKKAVCFTNSSHIEDDKTYLDRLFSDEAAFHVCGTVKRHSCIWGSENPHDIEHEHDSPHVSVCCTWWKTKLLLYFFFKNVQWLVHFSGYDTALHHVPVGTVFWLDGAPPHLPHSSCHVSASPDREFPGHWLGSGGPILWSPCSPDLSPLDFFFLGIVKDIVFHEKVQNMNGLCDIIVRIAECVTSEMLVVTWQGTEYHPDVCYTTNCAHIEICWAHKKLCEVQGSKIYWLLQ